MRVLLLDVNCKYSSTGKIVYDLYTQLIAEGHEAAIGYGRGPKIEGKNIYRFSPVWEVYLHALLTRLTGYTGCFSYIATRRLIRFLKKFQPEVVHLNDMHGYFVNIKRLVKYLKKQKIKTIWTFHCEFMYTGKCGHAYECEKWKYECGRCPHMRDYPESWWFDRTKKMLHMKKQLLRNWQNLIIVVPSQWLKNRVEQSFIKDIPISIIYNGIDTNVFCRKDTKRLREQLKIRKDEKVVLAVAPNIMSDQKGGKHVLQVAQNMRTQNVRFIMVGIYDLNEQFDTNVLPVGMLKDQELLAEYYSLASVFLICSKCENYPTVCVEAAMCGAPIVGYDVGGTSETVPPERGIFVPYGDIAKLQEGIEYFLYGTQKKMDQRECPTTYSVERMYHEYKKLYLQNTIQ